MQIHQSAIRYGQNSKRLLLDRTNAEAQDISLAVVLVGNSISHQHTTKRSSYRGNQIADPSLEELPVDHLFILKHLS